MNELTFLAVQGSVLLGAILCAFWLAFCLPLYLAAHNRRGRGRQFPSTFAGKGPSSPVGQPKGPFRSLRTG